MKFSESWLREWVNPSIETAELVSRITMAGLEVDGVEAASEAFSGVIVGEIIAAEKHPNADKLQVCQVKGANEDTYQVVCGAPNARVGIKVPFATIGAVLPDNFKIKRAKLRGVESFGMLCAEKELGVSEASEGLWELPADAPTGKDLREYVGLNDKIIEVDLTPNRGDCLSINGLAREVGVLCKEEVSGPAIAATNAVSDERFPVSLNAGSACPRYVGRVIRGVNSQAPSPLWMVERLRRSGIRSIDPVVDVTNYVLLELGQPMHGFDLARLQGGITVRLATAGEKLVLLDGAEHELTTETLVITDDSGPLAMAGIMGGKGTGVSSSTTDIFLESAFFDPLAIVGRARHYGLHTDSSHRFERGVNPDLCLQAMDRATALLLDIVGGEVGPVICEELTELLPAEKTVTLKKSFLSQQLAVSLDDAVVEDIFQRLGLVLLSSNSECWQVKIPAWRFDIDINADLVEEVARIYGYNNLPTTTLTAPMAISESTEGSLSLERLKTLLIDRGFNEAITYSFVEPGLMSTIDPSGAFVEVANPISSDMSVMRTSLWAGLIDALKRNISRQQSRAMLFESGLRFTPGEAGAGLQQELMIAGLMYGSQQDENWHGQSAKVDFYHLKGHVESLLAIAESAESPVFEPSNHPALHPGQSAQLSRHGEVIGCMGRLHPSVEKQLGLEQAVFVFELKVAPLLVVGIPACQPISRYPDVRRDIAVIVDKDVAAYSILESVRQAAGKLLSDLKIFDVYEGKGIENNRKSIALGLTYQEQSRTLNESEVTASIDAVIDRLKTDYQATLRG